MTAPLAGVVPATSSPKGFPVPGAFRRLLVATGAEGRLHRVDAPVLCVVLNQIDLEKADNYYGEYSGYGNRYYRKYGYYGKDRATV